MTTKTSQAMTSRERMKRAIEFGTPDRIPLMCCVQPSAWYRHGKALEDLLRTFPLDEGFPVYDPAMTEPPQTWTDEWQCVWERGQKGEYGTCVGHPLADWEKIKTYEFPKVALLPQMVPKGDVFRIAMGATEYGVLWYRMQFLRGFENILMDMVAEPGNFIRVRDGVMGSRLYYLDQMLKEEVDAIYFGDCWGMQASLMVHPDQWRELFKPVYKSLFDRVHAAGKKVVFQSDGYTIDIVDDLVEIGVDMIRLSLGMMDMDALGQKLRGKVCLWADPCRQHILAGGTPREVKDHIRRIVKIFRTPKGGLVGAIYIDDVPLANIQAAYEAYLEG